VGPVLHIEFQVSQGTVRPKEQEQKKPNRSKSSVAGGITIADVRLSYKAIGIKPALY